MKVFQFRSFERKVKKFTKRGKNKLDEQIGKIIDNPYIGSEKKGDLRSVYVNKFKLRNVQYLIAYRFIGEDLELVMTGPHKNYYRELKSYLKNR